MTPNEVQKIIYDIEEECDLNFKEDSLETMPHYGVGHLDDGSCFCFESTGNSSTLTLKTLSSEETSTHEFSSALIGRECSQASEWVDLFRTLLYNLDCNDRNKGAYKSIKRKLKG